MTYRPYSTTDVAGLEALFDARGDDPEIVEALIAELSARSDAEAEPLRRRLAAAREAPDGDDVLAQVMFEALRGRLLDLSPANPLIDDRARLDGGAHVVLDESLDEAWRRFAVEGGAFDLGASAPLDAIAEDGRRREEESGSSSPFLVFGWLERRAAGAAETPLIPLLLLPARLERRSAGDRTLYGLSAARTAIVNPALGPLLIRDYGRPPPPFPLDSEETASPEAWLHALDAAAPDAAWRTRRMLVLGSFPVGRLLIRDDLGSASWPRPAAAHRLAGPVLRAMAGRTQARPPEPPPIDETENEKHAPVLIHDCDSMQHAAVADAAKGLDVIIHAPPGTGKAETIANIVAAALARGETALVLSGAHGALEAVRARLDEAGLGPFKLDLYGARARPQAVRRSLKERMGPQAPRIAAPRPDLPAFDGARKDLSAYFAALHEPQDGGETMWSMVWRNAAGSSRHGAAARALRGVEVAERFAADPQDAERAGQALAAYAVAAKSFEDSFGSPEASAWARLDLSSLSSAAAPGIVERLAAVRQASLNVAGLFDGLKSLGVATPADLRRVAEAGLPAAGRLSAIGWVEILDLDYLEEAIVLLRRIRERERDLAGAESLMEIDAASLSRAEELGETARACGFGDLAPAKANERAERELQEAQQLMVALNGLLDAAPLLGFGAALESRLLIPIAMAASAAVSIPMSLRERLSWSPAGAPEAFEPIAAKGKALAESEDSWRKKARGYASDDRPSPEDLRQAAESLRQGGVKRMAAAMFGGLGAARVLVEDLALDGAEETWPERLERLAAHVEAIQAFEADQNAARIVGPSWKGADTPFGLMTAVLRLRGAMRDGLKDIEGGPDVAERMLRMDVRTVTEFGGFAPAAASLRAVPGWRTALGPETAEETLGNIGERIINLAAFLGRDPIAFAGIDMPIERIAALAQIEVGRRALFDELDRNPTAPTLSEERLDSAADAIAWLRAVRAADLPTPVRRIFLSERAEEARRKLLPAAGQARDHLLRLQESLDGLDPDFARASGLAEAAERAGDLAERSGELLRHAESLQAFLELREKRAPVESMDLAGFLAKAHEARVRTEDLGAAFVHLAARRRMEALRRVRSSVWRSGSMLEARRRIFADQDLLRMAKDRETLQLHLFAAAHAAERAQPGLRSLDESLRQDRRFDVRRTMTDFGAAVQALKPCVLASPLDLCAELPPEAMAFDVVVIDEASSLKVEEVLCGLLRAKRAVVVGDPEGLRPEDEAGPSALEMCGRAFGIVRRLTRHVESRCDSLIAFSNREIYESGLSVLPAARPDSFAIDLVRLDGEAKDGRNRAEAERIAQDAVAFMRRFAKMDEGETPTLGLVAATGEQRDSIVETLKKLEADDAAVALFRERAARRGEPVFVRALAAIQGETRDVIFASLVYGRDAAGRVGSFAGRDGVRFVNALATRARVRLALFASLGADDVKLTPSSGRGERLLKSYLAYVEGGARAAQTKGEPRTPFEAQIAGRLEARGYKVDLQLGASGGRPLIGVRRTDRPDVYLAGIAGDSAADPPENGARDRDRLRDEALRRLGWEIVRIWSIDWFEDADFQANKLILQLEGLQRKSAAGARSADQERGEAAGQDRRYGER